MLILERLDFNLVPEEYQDVELYDLNGYEELVNAFVFSGLVAIQEAFQELDSEKVFEAINYKKGFMFLIGEHDSGEVYPLLIKE